MADPGEALISCDFSQIEPRLVAEIADETAMIHAYLHDRDLYSEMASRVFKVPYELCGDGSDYRKKMKTLFLGILYGMTDKGLAARLFCTVGEARDILNMFFSEFKGLKAAMRDTEIFCKNNSFVETLLQRKRRLPDIWHEEWWIRNAVKRKVFNAVIQGTAADIMKMAMVNIGTDKRIISLGGRPLVTVHDEIIVSAPKLTAIEIAGYVEEDMKIVAQQIGIVKVPFKCDSEIFLDGRWASQYSIELQDVISGKIKPEEIEWRLTL